MQSGYLPAGQHVGIVVRLCGHIFHHVGARSASIQIEGITVMWIGMKVIAVALLQLDGFGKLLVGIWVLAVSSLLY